MDEIWKAIEAVGSLLVGIAAIIAALKSDDGEPRGPKPKPPRGRRRRRRQDKGCRCRITLISGAAAPSQTNPWTIMNAKNTYGLVSLACGAMCLILAVGGRAVAAGIFGATAGVFGCLAGGRR
ncbi:hypothetical protein [Bifidobacterium jacchi]|uniref:Uncharacterized protein n=1 Tax=Bifidobacterium jacchi TaxID=2490545 RepID=A0A5N5RGP7_9BIFI|nr:hypothetical protein [Bifidobacterium jacchi]KAB5606442.1 hypothetical protein EHS19_07475 [Bifidobacterium jacchi]